MKHDTYDFFKKNLKYINYIKLFKNEFLVFIWGLGIGDWGLGIWEWG